MVCIFGQHSGGIKLPQFLYLVNSIVSDWIQNDCSGQCLVPNFISLEQDIPSLMKLYISFPSLVLSPGRGGGDERGGDDPRLASGCKFRILVLLRVFWGKCHYIISRKGLFLGLHVKKYKNLCIFNSFYLIVSCNQSLKWSLLGA